MASSDDQWSYIDQKGNKRSVRTIKPGPWSTHVLQHPLNCELWLHNLLNGQHGNKRNLSKLAHLGEVSKNFSWSPPKRAWGFTISYRKRRTSPFLFMNGFRKNGLDTPLISTK